VLAADKQAASGMSPRSASRWYLEPGLPRSVGFGPVRQPRLVRTLNESRLARALDADPVARTAYDRLACNHKREHVCAIKSATKP
jgi:hypothetical protein